MEGRLVLKDCCVYLSRGSVKSGTAVAIEGGKISKVAPNEAIPILPGDWEVDCRGRLAMPGLVDCHAHLVSGQLSAFGADVVEMESKLSAGEVEALTAFALARALRFGVTTVMEHLRCPSEVAGGLEAQARTAERLGMRLIASHATDSRARSALAQLEANAESVLARRAHPLVRCALGFHASYDGDDELLSRLGRLRNELGVGAHGHVAESELDEARTVEVFHQRVVPRLEAHGLLGDDCLAAYASAIDRAEAERLASSGTLVALSPLRRWIDPLAGAGFELLAAHKGRIALGTAGSISLGDEVMAIVGALVEAARSGRLLDPDGMLSDILIAAPAALCSRVFGEPFGAIEPGGQADLVVYDLVPPAERRQGVAADLLVRSSRAPVAWTIVAGQVVVREGQLLAHDYVELDRQAQRALESLRGRTGVRSAAVAARGDP